MNAPASTTKYPPFPLVFLLTSSLLLISLSVSFSLSLSLNPIMDLVSWRRISFVCTRQVGEVGEIARGGPRAWTKDTFIAVGSGWLQTDNGNILQFLKQIAVCSLPS